MTTIAYRAGVLAVDTACSSGNVILPHGQGRKVLRTGDGRLVGAAGNGAWTHWFRAWATEPDPAQRSPWRDPPDDDGLGVIVLRDGSVWEFATGGGAPGAFAPYDAWGAGAKFAFGAMHAGAGAQDAVRAAIAHDPFTAGDVVFVALEAGEVRALEPRDLVGVGRPVEIVEGVTGIYRRPRADSVNRGDS